MEYLTDYAYWLIGIDEQISDLSALQMVARTVVVYGVSLLLIRLAKRRFLGGYTAFDILMGFVLGSIMSRAITGSETLFSAVVVVLTLVAIHYLISLTTYYFGDANDVVKNRERKLVSGGEVDEKAMEASKIGEPELLQAIRDKAGAESLDEVESVYLERDGSIAVIPKRKEPRIVEIDVREGVQTVRLEVCG